VRIKINPQGVSQLEGSPKALALIKELTEATAAACNRESSWDDPEVDGGYFSHIEDDGIRARGRVWSIDQQRNEARKNRLVRNLGGGG
jgi:hypothetical protein